MMTSAVVLSVILSSTLSLRPEPQRGEPAPRLDESYRKRLRDPDRRIFNLPLVADPWAIPRLPPEHPELDALRESSMALRPLRIVLSSAMAGLLIYGADRLSAPATAALGTGRIKSPSTFLTYAFALPVLPLGVALVGAFTRGEGTVGATMLGAAVASVLGLGFATFVQLMGGGLSPPYLLAFPVVGAVLGYELSSSARLNTQRGPRHPVLPLLPRVLSAPPIRVRF